MHINVVHYTSLVPQLSHNKKTPILVVYNIGGHFLQIFLNHILKDLNSFAFVLLFMFTSPGKLGIFHVYVLGQKITHVCSKIKIIFLRRCAMLCFSIILVHIYLITRNMWKREPYLLCMYRSCRVANGFLIKENFCVS